MSNLTKSDRVIAAAIRKARRESLRGRISAHPMMTANYGSIRLDALVDGLEIVTYEGRRGVVSDVHPHPSLSGVLSYTITWSDGGIDAGCHPGYLGYSDGQWALPVAVARDNGLMA